MGTIEESERQAALKPTPPFEPDEVTVTLPSKDTSEMADRGRIDRAATLLAAGTMVSRVLGLVRDMLIARYFPLQVRDAFVVAFRLPNFFRRIFGEGVIAASLVPVLTEAHNPSKAGHKLRARELLSVVFTMLTVVTLVLGAVGILFMNPIMQVLVGGKGYMDVLGKFDLTVSLARIMFALVVFSAVSACFSAALFAQRRFRAAGLAPVAFNVTLIAALWWTRGGREQELWASIGVVAGGILQTMVLIPPLLATHTMPKLTFNWQNQDALKVLKLFVPNVAGVGLLQLTAVVNMRFASNLPQGTVSYFYLADRMIELPIALFVLSVGSALLPTLSELWSHGHKQVLGHTAGHYLRVVLFVALPASLGLGMLARPITEVLFLGREFKLDDVLATSLLIRIYTPMLLLAAFVRILSQVFFATQRAWFPAFAGGVCLISHVLLAYALSRAFAAPGLAIANVLSSLLHVILLLLAYHRWIAPLEWRPLHAMALRLLPGLLSIVGCCLSYRFLLDHFVGPHFPRVLILALDISCAALGYFLLAYLFRVQECRVWLRSVRPKWIRKTYTTSN